MAVTNRDLLRDFTVQIKLAVSKDSCDILSKAVEKAPGSDDAKSMWLDQAFREYLTGETMRVQTASSDIDKFDKYIELSIQAAQRNLCSKVTPITLLSDMCDIITLDQCETLFGTIERNIQLWKSEEFFTPIRNNLLRICNDLLRRLSRSQNTVFCGRILLFLAKFFPFSERSGLNVVSEFNLENTTVFSSAEEVAQFKNGSSGNDKEDKDEDEAMEVEDGIKIEADQRSLSVDYALYSKFWKLQDFFRNPNQCYTNVNWRTFSTYSADVLKTFKSFKVDVISGKATSGGEQFFAKYLTNQNLLQLQLSDSNFRRYVLVQFLILFQYLKSSVKFKSETQVLTDEQSRWIEKTEKVIHELINETPPDGSKFSMAVKHILHRETQWNIWKNQGCKPLTPKEDPKESKPVTSPSKSLIKTGTTRKRKAKLGDQIQQAVKQGKFLMGNQVLTKLWNQYPDNMDACSAPERDFLPSMEEYFSEAIDQLDPNNQIEEEYKIVKDGQWGWRALRLLAKKSPYFFTYGNNPIARLPDYLDSMLKKMSNFTPSTPNNASANGTNGTKEVGKTEASADLCTKENLSKIASNLGEEWPKLLPKLGLSQEDGEKFTKDGKTSQERGELMLTKWLEIEGEGATKEEITYILEGLKMSKALEGVFNNS